MKYRQEIRQITALELTSRHVKGYRQILKTGVSAADQAEFLAQVASNPKEVDLMSKDEVRKALEDKLAKAEKCVADLRAKGVGLGIGN